MADLFPDEGLDALLAIVPKNGTNATNMFLGLYTAQGGNSVPLQNATLTGAGNNMGGCAEVSATQWTTYGRQTHPAGSWGAQTGSNVWTTTGRIVTGSQLSFPAPTGSAYNPTPNQIAGFFLADSLATNVGKAYYYSNFSDTSLIANLQVGDIVKVTPSFGYGN